MNESFNSISFKITVILFLIIIFYYCYYFFANSQYLKNFISRNENEQRNKVVLFLAEKFTGFLFLGFVPGIIYYFTLGPFWIQFGLNLKILADNIILIALLVIIIAALIYLNQKLRPSNNSLQMNFQEWNIRLFTLDVVGWLGYLAAYEFLFRGILLFACYDYFGFWPAIAVNVVIYSAIHMVNGKDQTIGALFFGTLACYLTLSRGTIFIPFFMHASLSLFSDYFSIKFNPDLKYLKNQKYTLPKR